MAMAMAMAMAERGLMRRNLGNTKTLRGSGRRKLDRRTSMISTLGSIGTALVSSLAREPSLAAVLPAETQLLGAGQSGVPSSQLGTCDGSEQFQCFTSMDDRPPFFTQPWEFPARDGGGEGDDAIRAVDAMVDALDSLHYENIVVAPQEAPTPGFYISASSSSSLVEFFIEGDGADNLVQVRLETVKQRGTGLIYALGRLGSSPQAELRRIRLALGWSEVVVLRNRRRVFAIVESGWDEFGPVAPIGEVDPDDALALDGPRGYEKTKD